MNVLKCPECGMAIHVVFKDRAFSGWKKCDKCGDACFVVVREDGAGGVRSLASIARSSGTMPQTLKFLSENKEVFANDLLFAVGKLAQDDLDLLAKLRVIDKSGVKLSLNPVLAGAVKKYVPADEERDVLQEFLEKD